MGAGRLLLVFTGGMNYPRKATCLDSLSFSGPTAYHRFVFERRMGKAARVKAAQLARDELVIKGLKVGIIGAGVGGLAAAKELLQLGSEVVVWDKNTTVGGVWAEGQSYHSAKLQAPWWLYQFPGFPNKSKKVQAADLREYFQSYSDHFGVTPSLKLGRKVVAVSERTGSDAGYSVETASVRSDGTLDDFETTMVDKLIVATGINSTPHLPDFAQEAWKKGSTSGGTRILHSSQVTSADVDAAKRIIVVGGSKSALDCAVMAPEKTALLSRSRHDWFLQGIAETPYWDWNVTWGGAVPYARRVWRGQGWCCARSMLKTMTTCLAPRVVRCCVPSFAPPKKPDILMDTVLNGSLNVSVTRKQWKKLQQLRTPGILATPTGFTDDGRGLTWRRSDGEEDDPKFQAGALDDADLIIFATGYIPDAGPRAFFPNADFGGPQGGDTSDGIYLWRGLLHPSTPNVAYIGLGHESAFNPIVRAVQAFWVAALFTGSMLGTEVEAVMSRPGAMAEEIAQRAETSRKLLPFTHRRAAVSFVVMDEIEGPLFNKLYEDVYGPRAVPSASCSRWCSYTPLMFKAGAPIVAEQRRAAEVTKTSAGVE